MAPTSLSYNTRVVPGLCPARSSCQTGFNSHLKPFVLLLMYKPWQSFTGYSGHHMTGVDIGERGERWPLTGGGSRAEVFENQSEEHLSTSRGEKKNCTQLGIRGVFCCLSEQLPWQPRSTDEDRYHLSPCSAVKRLTILWRFKYLERKIIIKVGFLFIVSFCVTEAAASTNTSWFTRIDMVTINDSEPQIEIEG